MESNINFIQIGKARNTLIQPRWVSDWHIKNNPEQAAAIPETNDGTLHWQNVEEWLRPEINFTFNFLNVDDYAQAEKILVLGAFVCKHYNPAIKKWFTGLYKLTDNSVNLFLRTYGNKYTGVVDYSFKAKSVFTYDNYQQLEDKAENDIRF